MARRHRSTHGTAFRERSAGGRGVRAPRPPRLGRHGPRLPRLLPRRQGGRDQGRAPGAGPRSRVPAPVPAGGRVGPPGQRHVHRAGGRLGGRRRPALAGHRLRSRPAAGRRGQQARPAGRERRLAARGRPGRRAARGARLRPGAPGPQARQRAAGGRRAARDRLRHLPRVREHPADLGRDGGRDPWLHVARAGRGPAGGPAERCLLARLRARLRGDRQRAVRRRQRRLHPLPGGHRPARPERHPGRPAAGHHGLPGQGPGPADRAGAAHRHGLGPRAAAARHPRRVLARAAGQHHRRRPGPASAHPGGQRSGRPGLGPVGPGSGRPGSGRRDVGGRPSRRPTAERAGHGAVPVEPRPAGADAGRDRARADGGRRLLRGGGGQPRPGPGLTFGVRAARGRAVVAVAVPGRPAAASGGRAARVLAGVARSAAVWRLAAVLRVAPVRRRRAGGDAAGRRPGVPVRGAIMAAAGPAGRGRADSRRPHCRRRRGRSSSRPPVAPGPAAASRAEAGRATRARRPRSSSTPRAVGVLPGPSCRGRCWPRSG